MLYLAQLSDRQDTLCLCLIGAFTLVFLVRMVYVAVRSTKDVDRMSTSNKS